MLVVGLAFATLGWYALSHVTVDSSYAVSVVIPMALIGIGQGLSLARSTVSGWPVSKRAMRAPRQASSTLRISWAAHSAWQQSWPYSPGRYMPPDTAGVVAGSSAAFVAGSGPCGAALLVAYSLR
jgi:hypothetical protein